MILIVNLEQVTMYAKGTDDRKKDFKPTVCMPDGRRKRDEIKLKIRKDKKDANIRRRRMGALCLSDNLDSSTTGKIGEIENAMNILTRQTATKDETIGAIKYIRKKLGAQDVDAAVVNSVVKAGLVPLLLTVLKHQPENPVGLIAETILALTNLSAVGGNASLGIERTVETIAPFIHHDHPEVRTQAAWCLGTIASENNSYRNWLIRQDVIVKGLIRNVMEPQNMEILEAVLWTMSILCGCKVSFVVVESMVSPICDLVLHHFYELPLEVLVYAVETIMLLSDGNNDQIQAVMDTGITPVLVRLLKGDLPLIKDKSWPLTTRVIRCLGNFTSGTEEQTQTVISAGVLAHVGAVINNGSQQAQKEACWLVSNIAAGTQAQISELLKANILRQVSLKAYQSEAVVRQEALYAVANICNRGADEHVRTIVEFDGIRALTTFVDKSSDVALLVEVLNAINRILEVGETKTWLEYDSYFEQYNGIERLEELADSHPSSEISNLASKILDRFFPSQDSLDENLVPDQSADGPFSPRAWEVRKKLQFDAHGPRTNLSFGFANTNPPFARSSKNQNL